jgi:hypothetical protein
MGSSAPWFVAGVALDTAGGREDVLVDHAAGGEINVRWELRDSVQYQYNYFSRRDDTRHLAIVYYFTGNILSFSQNTPSHLAKCNIPHATVSFFSA